MNSFTVTIGPIHIVLTGKVLKNLYEKKQRNPLLPDEGTIPMHIQEMRRLGGIPAIVTSNREGKNQLLLYIPSYSYHLLLYESPQRDAYTVAYVDTLYLREHERLSQGALLLQAQDWVLHRELRTVPRGGTNSWNHIAQKWQILEQQRHQTSPQQQQQALSQAHENYLDTLADLIEVTHRLEQEKNSLSAGISYKSVETAGGERETSRDIYIFRLNEVPLLTEKSMLCVRDAPDLKGRVQEIEGAKLTLKFETKIDRRRIPDYGVLEPVVNPIIYQKQCAALETIRAREAKNVHLLSVLAGHMYQPYQPDPIQQESDEDLKLLTSEQFEAFRRALTVPDMLMVLGPPGTGKTRTITEIARYSGSRHQRVLVTSGTHKAVDNVLERMPPDLIVLRVGHENNISEKMRPHMIDAQAQEMQKIILENTENQANRLTRLLLYKREITDWIAQMNQGITYLAGNETYLQSLNQQRFSIEQQIEAPFRGKFAELSIELQKYQKRFASVQKNIRSWEEKSAKAETRHHLPMIGWIFTFLIERYATNIERGIAIIKETQQEIQRLQQAQRHVYETGQQTLHADRAYQQCMQHIEHLTAKNEQMWGELLKIAHSLQATIVDLESQQPGFEPKRAATLQRYISWYNETRVKLEHKARLMQDWREELKQPTDQLYPELLRYADVVGATCIGTATARGLESVEFDIAIVDEAGQIGLPDLLVPLVRAKRAVLVGDYNQLPPFMSSEVESWLRNFSSSSEEDHETIDNRVISDLLTKSAFEQLFATNLDSAHRVRFTRQGRMPQIIADFVSYHFYNDQLGTFSDDKMKHTLDRDPIFRHALTLIDTSDEPSATKWEREQKKRENIDEAGYINIAEAKIIISLVEVYERTGKDWIVIVPYRAQARYIIQELKSRIDEHSFSLEERVATVDSFQGGERKKVIYGFTRSNTAGKIGFLKELRRLNVAMTRAQQHLILIGNFSTLTQANDARFRLVITNLQQYALQQGEILSLASCYKRLRNI